MDLGRHGTENHVILEGRPRHLCDQKTPKDTPSNNGRHVKVPSNTLQKPPTIVHRQFQVTQDPTNTASKPATPVPSKRKPSRSVSSSPLFVRNENHEGESNKETIGSDPINKGATASRNGDTVVRGDGARRPGGDTGKLCAAFIKEPPTKTAGKSQVSTGSPVFPPSLILRRSPPKAKANTLSDAVALISLRESHVAIAPKALKKSSIPRPNKTPTSPTDAQPVTGVHGTVRQRTPFPETPDHASAPAASLSKTVVGEYSEGLSRRIARVQA
ncbi:hypothetical protein DL766_004876 [Monosporascus sp. MC13-8B]|uniref:Uncharacterized protein n=1 Tax=Monosporascus cannonballus TaxID=155416 RepID=A0ABY0GTY3_9PEZI|nr:hypothetical protein DL762_010396 [Monosporascus cannonballus]RYO99532.1 hypothetical protein DL763_001443 [Monosporascus cannonballus]RYP30426.1 hypothetical protein DL766_004876 [Monosporascus sp. MC13-8B]